MDNNLTNYSTETINKIIQTQVLKIPGVEKNNINVNANNGNVNIEFSLFHYIINAVDVAKRVQDIIRSFLHSMNYNTKNISIYIK